jgi:lipopolysaccharide export system permease protein
MIKTLDRYIIGQFFRSLVVVTLAVIVLVVAINLIEKLRDFVDHNVAAKDIALYYLYYSGWAVKSFLPIFVFLAGLFTVGVMARHNEIRATKAGGISIFRFSLPLLVVSLLLGGAHFYYNEFIFPPANKRMVELKEFTIQQRSKHSVINRRNLYRQVSDSVYYVIDLYSVPDRIGRGVKLYLRRKNTLGDFIAASEMRFNKGGWTLYDGSYRKQTDSGETFATFDSLPAPLITDRPDDLERRLGAPADMSYEELKYYINLMKRTGGPYLAELVELKSKISFPLTSFVVMILCVPLAARRRQSGMAGSLAGAAGLILLYFVSYKVTKSLGAHGEIPPNLAAWGVNGLFFVVGIIMNIVGRR